MESRLLGELLIERGLVTAADVQRALDMQGRIGGRIGALLMRVGAGSEDSLLDVLGAQLELPLLGRDLALPDEGAIRDGALANGISVDWMLDQQALADSLRFLLGARAPRYCLVRAQDLERSLDA